MFNTLLKKASESSFAALASEALEARPGSPATNRRPPGSPLAVQQQQQNLAGNPARKPKNPNTRSNAPNPHSSNAQLASQLDEAHNDIETFQKLLQKTNQEKSEIEKAAEQLKEENEALNEELQEARQVIKAMRASLEEKATGEFLSPKLDGEKDSFNVMEGHSSPITTRLEDPLGVVSIDQTEEKDLPRKKVSDAASFTLKQTGGEQAGDVVVLQANSSGTDALDEALKDLMQQLEAKTKQCEQLQNELGQRTAELSKQKSDHDEKMKKMKAIFAAANKNLNEYRQSIAAKDEEIAELKTKLENQQSSESQTVEQTQAIQELEAELKSQSEVAAIKLQQMESKNRQVNTQLEKLKTEYQQYKQRANLLLQQQRESVQTDDVGRLKELQEQLDNLTKDNRSIAKELQESEGRRLAQENELQVVLDQIASLESSIEISRRQERQHARQLKDLERSLKDAQLEREAAESRLASLQELRAVETQSLRQEIGGNTKYIEERLTKKEEENAELHRIIDRQSDELTAAKQEIQTLRDLVSNPEIGNNGTNSNDASVVTSPNVEQDGKSQGQQLLISTAFGPRSSFSLNEQESPISRASSSLSLPAERAPVYSTLSDLLAAKPLVDRSPFSDTTAGLGATTPMSTTKEREYQIKLQHLTELLNESEANHQRLLDQEKVLKEEIRNLDRAERRQNLSVDYLKNIVLKFLETNDREPLLPVLTTVLQLSPAEVASLRKKTAPPSASSLVLGSLFGGGGH